MKPGEAGSRYFRVFTKFTNWVTRSLQEKEKMLEEMKRLDELSEERLVAAENVRNELLTVQSQLRSLDEQMSRDRQKLLELRKEKGMLLEKARDSFAL